MKETTENEIKEEESTPYSGLVASDKERQKQKNMEASEVIESIYLTSLSLEPELILSPAFIKASKIRNEKQEDYGSIFDYFPFGAQSYCHELHKKVKRLVNLARTNQPPTNESVKDNLLDLINYASYYYEHLEGGENG